MLRDQSELTNLASHTTGNKLIINQTITNPANILLVADYINNNQIEIVKLCSVAPLCLEALTTLINNCKNIRSLTVSFSNDTFITIPLINAISNHPALFEISIQSLKTQFINQAYCNQLHEKLKYKQVKCESDDDSEESHRDYISANKEDFTPCVYLDLYKNMVNLFTSKTLAIIHLPQLFIPTNLEDSEPRVYLNCPRESVINHYIKSCDTEKVEEYHTMTKTSKQLVATIQSNRLLSVVITNHNNSYRDSFRFINVREETHENFLTLYYSLISEAHKRINNYDLLGTKEIIEKVDMLLQALDVLNKTIGYSQYTDNRKKVPNTEEFNRLKTTNELLLTAQYDFNDPIKRHRVFSNMWEKRDSDSVLAGFLVNLLLSADASQLPFLNYPHEKYYLILALFADNPESAHQALLRHAFHNAIKVAINPNAASDEMISEASDDEITYDFDRCVFFCTLVQFVQQQPGISKSVLESMPCSMEAACELLRNIPRPADTASEKMYNLLIAYTQPQHKADLFISVKETLFKTIQAWIKDPFQFEKDKTKREFRQEMLRNQQLTITLLQEQNRLLEEVRKNTQPATLKATTKQEPASPKLF